MSKVGMPAIDKIANLINGASDTKQAIIETANFDDILSLEIKKYEEKKKITEEQQKENFKFNPKEIQTLVYRDSREEAENSR